MSKTELVEKIEITRLESDRARIRKISDKGTDLALTLIPGSHINNGDVVMLTEEKMVIANRTPENVAMISLKGIMSQDQLFETAIKIGHTIGNMHRPIEIVGGKIFFPIQSQSEVELFQTLLSNLINNIVIKSENIIFEPESGYDVHEH
ncbi:MAG: urease accessory protein UreE [Nitrososphaeraceae archaeon]